MPPTTDQRDANERIGMALRRGVKPEVVARMVGHSSPLITLRIYRQVFEEELDEARDMLVSLI